MTIKFKNNSLIMTLFLSLFLLPITSNARGGRGDIADKKRENKKSEAVLIQEATAKPKYKLIQMQKSESPKTPAYPETFKPVQEKITGVGFQPVQSLVSQPIKRSSPAVNPVQSIQRNISQPIKRSSPAVNPVQSIQRNISQPIKRSSPAVTDSASSNPAVGLPFNPAVGLPFNPAVGEPSRPVAKIPTYYPSVEFQPNYPEIVQPVQESEDGKRFIIDKHGNRVERIITDKLRFKDEGQK